MNRDTLSGQWMQLRGFVKEKWGKLTDDDVQAIEGRLERFVGVLQERYGYARERAEHEIDEWLASRAKGAPKKGAIASGIVLAIAVLVPTMAGALGCTAPDAALTAKVKAKMMADTAVPASEIEVETRNKVVTLKGNVDSLEARNRAIEIARSTDGVVDVRDLISVRTSEGSGDAPEPSRTLGARIDDASITAAVKKRLLDDPVVEGLRIDVDTREGVVYLTGSVRSTEEREKAIQIARDTEHVRDVQANIRVPNA